MPYSVEGKLVVAISSRALFDFEEENRVFERDGEPAYIALQYGRLDVPAREAARAALLVRADRRGGGWGLERPVLGNPAHSTVTLFARLRGWSTAHPRSTAM